LVVNDNFGILISALFRAPSALVKTVVLKDIAGVSRNLDVFNTDGANLFNDVATAISKVQVGKGLSPATRQDVNIESPFTNGGVEDNRIDITQPAGYNSGLGKVTVATLINPTAGAGAITEVCYYLFIRDNSGTVQTFLIFRNNLTVPVNFIASQSINIDSEVFI